MPLGISGSWEQIDNYNMGTRFEQFLERFWSQPPESSDKKDHHAGIEIGYTWDIVFALTPHLVNWPYHNLQHGKESHINNVECRTCCLGILPLKPPSSWIISVYQNRFVVNHWIGHVIRWPCELGLYSISVVLNSDLVEHIYTSRGICVCACVGGGIPHQSALRFVRMFVFFPEVITLVYPPFGAHFMTWCILWPVSMVDLMSLSPD